MLKPLNDQVVLEMLELYAEEETKGGIIIPEDSRDLGNRALVVDVGPGKKVKNKRTKRRELRPMEVSIGDVVLVPYYEGTSIKSGGKYFLIIAEEKILAVVDHWDLEEADEIAA